MIIISAMTWWMTISWEAFGGGGIFIISVAYAILFTFLGAKLWKKHEYRVPAGLLITIAVCMTPLAIYGLETYFNIWPEGNPGEYRDFYNWIKGSWIFMEIGTIVAGVVALRFFRFPFITAPIFFSAWFLSMDIVPIIMRNEITWRQREWVSLIFGIVLIVISYLIHRAKRKDFAFWGYLFGTFAFWGGLSGLAWDKGEFVYFMYFVINFLMMIVSVLLSSKVFLIFGAIGTFAYFSHLAYEVFENSILFPFVLTFFGVAIIYLGVLYQKNMQWIEKTILNKIPSSIKRFLPDNHE